MNPNRRRTGSACGEVEHLAGAGPAAGEVEQPGGHAEQRVGLGERPVGQPDPQPVRGVPALADHVAEAEARPRSAARRSRCRGTSPGCRAARASGRRRAARAAPRAAPRPGGPAPWQACTCTDRSSSASSRRRRRRRRRVLAAQVVPAASRAASSGAGCGRRRRRRAARAAAEGALQLADVAARAWPAAGGATRRWLVSVGAGTGPRRVRRERLPEGGGGVRQPQVHVAVLAEGGEQLDLGDRQPGVAEQRQPGRQVEDPGCSRSRARVSRWRSVRRRRVDPVERAGARARAARPGRRRSAPPQPSVSAAGAPVLDQPRPLHGVRREEPRQPPAPRRTAGRAAGRPRRRRSPWPRCTRERARPGLVQGRRRAAPSSGQASASGAHGSSSRVPVISATSERGVRKSTPAQTPSPRPAPAAEPVREPLGEPALDAPGGHHHDLASANGSGSGTRAGRRARRPARRRDWRDARAGPRTRPPSPENDGPQPTARHRQRRACVAPRGGAATPPRSRRAPAARSGRPCWRRARRSRSRSAEAVSLISSTLTPLRAGRPQVQRQLLVVPAGDQRGERDQRAGAPVEAGPGPDGAPGVLR